MDKNEVITKIHNTAQEFGDKLDGVADQKFDGGGYLRRVFAHARGDWVSTISLMLLAIIGYEIGYEITFALLGWLL
jgi:hypothetical protein